MKRRHRLGPGLLMGLAIASATTADEPGGAASNRQAAASGPEASEPVASVDEAARLELLWSLSPTLVYTRIASPENDDDVGGFFDQYWFTPNKSSPVPLQVGLRDASLDLMGARDTPLLQARLRSPSSNLGVTGKQIDQPFFNQRLETLTRLRGLDVDLFYRRIRTEHLRTFPNTTGPGLIFQDLTSPDDRFYRDRTGFDAELRLRPAEISGTGKRLERFSPQLSLRGGYDARNGRKQLRFHRRPSNEWLGLSQKLRRSVGDVGGGLLVAPKGLLTIDFDFDYQRYRFDSDPITEGQLGFPPPASTRTIGFVPSSDRYTGTVRLSSRIGERALLEGGFQISELKQAGKRSPDQIAAGLEDNDVRFYSVNAALDAWVWRNLYFNAFFKFDQRDNRLERDTPLFNDSNGTQVGPFLDSWRRIFTGGELAMQLAGANRAALGLTYEDVDRDLDFARAGNPRILPANAHVQRTTRIITIYARSSLRPWRGLRLNGEIGYQIGPETGYIVDFERAFYGELRASYVFSLPRPLVVSAFARGRTGDNDDFTLTSGQGPEPDGAVLPRSYDRSGVTWGLTASSTPLDRLDLFASFFWHHDYQDTGLDLSSLQRRFQDLFPILFENAGLNRFENEQLSLVVGGRYQLTARTDLRLRYGFTHADARYRGDPSSPLLQRVEDARIIDSDVHDVDLELGHWLRDGLRVFAGYRLQLYDDRAPVYPSIASVVPPFGPSTHQHTVTLGVTLNSDLASSRF